MVAHEDVEDDAHWIKWLRHAAQVDSRLFAAANVLWFITFSNTSMCYSTLML